MKKGFVILASLALYISAFGQQNTLVNQYMFAGIVLNPAYAGVNTHQEIKVLHRNQWVGVENAPTTNFITIHGPLKNTNKNVGTGLSIQHDKIGTNSQTEFSGMYSYKMQVGEVGKLAFGLRAGLFFFNSNWDNENVFDEEDPMFNGGVNNEFFANFGTGVYYYTHKMYAGLASQRLMTYGSESGLVKNVDNRQFSDRITFLYGGYEFELGSNFKLKPNALFKLSRGTKSMVDINANLLVKNAFWIGVSHKVNQGWAGMFQLEILDPLKFGYAYDMRMAKVASNFIGSHEIMLSYDLGKIKVIENDTKLF